MPLPNEERRSPKEAAPRSDGEKLKSTVMPGPAWWVRTGPASGFLVDIDHVAVRVLAEAMADASAAWWRWRAEQLAAGLSRPGDYLGRRSPEEVAERNRRIRQDVARCLRHAQLLSDPACADVDEVWAVLREAA